MNSGELLLIFIGLLVITPGIIIIINSIKQKRNYKKKEISKDPKCYKKNCNKKAEWYCLKDKKLRCKDHFKEFWFGKRRPLKIKEHDIGFTLRYLLAAITLAFIGFLLYAMIKLVRFVFS